MAIQKVQFIIDAVDNASKTLKEIWGNVDWMWWKMNVTKADFAIAGGSITAAIWMIWTKAINVFGDFEKTMSGVKAVLDPTTEDFKRLSDMARELGRSTQYSAQESASAIEMLAKNWLNVTQILDGAADASLNLAAATGAQLSTAADIATSSMLSFWLSVKDLDQVVDSITWTTNVSKFWIEDYAQALAQGGWVAKAVGVNFADFNAWIAAISPSFSSGSDAGTSFKTMLLRLVPSSNNAAEAMQELWIITEDGSNRFFDAQWNMKWLSEVAWILQESFSGLSDEQRNQYMNTIFWTDALRAASAMASVGADEFTKLSAAIEWTDAAKNAAARMDNRKGTVEQLNGAIDDLWISLWSMLAPALKVVAVAMTWIANGVSKVLGVFEQLPAPIQNAVKLIAWITVAWIALTGAYAAASFALAGVWTAMVALVSAALPFIAIAAWIWLALYWLYEIRNSNFLWIKDATISALGVIQERFWKISAERLPIIQNALQWIRNVVSTVWNGIATLIGWVMDWLVWYISANWESISMITQGVWNIISWFFDMTLGVMLWWFKAFLQVLGGDWSGAWETIKTTLFDAWNWILEIFNWFLMVFQWTLTLAFDTVKAYVSTVWSNISTALSVIWNGIKTIASGIFTGIKTTIFGVFDSIAWFFSWNWKAAIEAAFSSMIWSLGWMVKSVFNGILWTIEWFVNNAIDWINRLISAMNQVNPLFKIASVPRIAIWRLAHGWIAGQWFFWWSVVSWPGGVDKVPAMLSAGEVVLNAAQQSNLANNLERWWSWMNVTVVVSWNDFFGAEDSFAWKIGDALMSEFKQHFAI